DAVAPGGLGGTYGGSPIGCAAAHAVLDVIADENLCARAIEIGTRIRDWAEARKQGDPSRTIGDIRTTGAMAAIEFVRDGDPDRPAPEIAQEFTAAAARAGVILLSCGVRGNVVRFLPPLTITDALLDEGLGRLERPMRRIAEI